MQIFADDVEAGKPAPDCFSMAAARLGTAASRCLVVEDAPAGVRAGKAAGCTVVGLTTTYSRSALHEANVCVATLADVRRLLVTHGLLIDTPTGPNRRLPAGP